MKRFIVILILPLLFLIACSSTPSSGADGTRVFSGRVTGYTQGNAEIISVSDDGANRLGEGTIKPNGDFEFTYVATPPASVLYGVAEEGFFCSELLGAPSSVQLVFDNLLSIFVPGNNTSVGYFRGASTRAAYTNERKAGDFQVYRVYVTDDLTLQGNCTSKALTLNYQFKKGWNVAVRSFVDDGAGGLKEEGKTVAPTFATNWFYQDYSAQ